MRIMVEALGISKFGGGRSATLNLFEYLIPLASQHQFIFILEDFEPTLDHQNVTQIIVPIRNRFVSRIWLQINLPKLVQRERVDLVHFAKNLTVFRLRSKIMVTLYDLTLLQYPAGFSKIDLLYWKFLQPRMLHQAHKIHAISQNTANDLKRLYYLPDKQIKVVYPPCNPIFRVMPDCIVSKIRACYNLPEQVVMHIGSFGPKKNVETLVKAFARIADSFHGKLVLVGGSYRSGYDAPIRTLVAQLGLTEKVIFTGIVPQEDLPGLINAAMIMVFPSLHEGFGIVATETMACGIPLIVNTGGALHEVVGDSGLVMDDPYDDLALSETIQRLYQDEVLRTALRRRGLIRSKLFTPSIASKQILELYQEIVDCV